MEEVKHAVAYRKCRDSGHSVDDVYAKIISIASNARRCYAADDAKVKGLSDAEFATMMFLDGCFLLWLMAGSADDPLLRRCAISAGPSFLKDISMLENQIPWLVLEALMEFWPVDVDSFVYAKMMDGFLLRAKGKMVPSWIMRSQRFLHTFLEKCRHVVVPGQNTNTEGEAKSITSHGRNFRPPHLLGLMRFILMHGMPPQERGSEDRDNSDERWPTIVSSSALDLAQIGVKVTVSTAGRFADMNVRKKCVFGELSLSPVFINDVIACYLVNLVALEAAGASTASSFMSDGYVVSSYLSVLAMLMDGEQDVHELRRRGVLSSHFSNTQMLAFFKGFGQHLRLGYNYFCIVGDIEEYMRRRPVRIAVHKFVYNNYKIIVAVLSIASVLVGIFKAIYSLKQQPY
jgi:hypothetical protein